MSVRRVALVLAIVLSGCAGAPPPVSESVAPGPPQVVHVLKLDATAVRGRVKLTRAGATHTATGQTSVTDDLGTWTFTYAPPADAGGPLGLGVRFRGASDRAVTVDWAESRLFAPDGAAQAVVFRSSAPATARALEGVVLPRSAGAEDAPRFFESLRPGGRVGLALAVRGDVSLEKRFVFEVRPLDEAPPEPRPISKWAGEAFVVLQRPPARSAEPYRMLHATNGVSRVPTPDELAGAILDVASAGYDRLDPVVKLVRRDTKETFTARPVGGSVEGLAPLADLTGARERWIGRTLWLAAPDLRSAAPEGDTVTVNRFAPVVVIDVRLGWATAAPIRIVVRAPGGRVGYRDVHMTGTNVPPAQRAQHAFERAFLTEDPHVEHDWPAEVWTAVEHGRVNAGMTAEQVRMSWGPPARVAPEGLDERWEYSDRPALTLSGGVVTQIHAR